MLVLILVCVEVSVGDIEPYKDRYCIPGVLILVCVEVSVGAIMKEIELLEKLVS